MNIHTNRGISQSLFAIPALVHRHSQVHPKFAPALWRASKLFTITPIVLLYQSSEIPVTPVPVVRDPSYSEGLPECPPRVWYSPEIDTSKFTLHILSDTPGVFQTMKIYCADVYLEMKFSVRQHKEPGVTDGHVPSYFVLFPQFLLVSIGFGITNPFSPIAFDFRVGRINPGTLGAALTSRCSGPSRSSKPFSGSISGSQSASQLSSQAFGLSKLPFQSS